MANRVGDVITNYSWYDYTITKAATATGDSTANRGTVNVKLKSAYINYSSISGSIATVVQQGSYYYTVTSAIDCFSGCSNLTTAPTLPNGLINITHIFRGCSSLAVAPTIPATVQNVEQAFYYCSALRGSITFNTTSLTSYSNAFAGTTGSIFIIPGSGADTTNLRAMAAPYGNVHYNTEDNPKPNIEEVTILRVSSSSSTTESNTGEWLYIVAKLHTYTTYLPVTSNTNGPASVFVTLDNDSNPSASKTSGFSVSTTDMTTTVSFWINTEDSERHVISIVMQDVVGKNSDIFRGIVSGSFATMDFHAGGDGVAIGTFSNGPGFVVAMDTTLPTTEVYGDLTVRGSSNESGDIIAEDGDFIDKDGNVLTSYHLEQTPNTNIVTLVPGSGNMTVTVPAIWG